MAGFSPIGWTNVLHMMLVISIVTVACGARDIDVAEETFVSDYPLGCQLNGSAEAVDIFRNSLSQISSFIYIRLEFDDDIQIYENSTDIIDPFAWVWSLEGKGYLLLTYPYDFVYLSWGALKTGVQHIDIPVSLPDSGCFQMASDEDREVILASFISDVAKRANDTLTEEEKEIYQEKDYRVCLERKNVAEGGTYASITDSVLTSTYDTHYQCWTGQALNQKNVTVPVVNVYTHNWPLIIISIIIIIAPFSPLVISLFIQHHPPVETDGKIFLAVNTDLPIGFGYWLFQWRNNSNLIVTLRSIFAFSIFFLIGSLHFIVPLAFYKETFFLHTLGRHLPPLTQAYISVICLTVFVFSVFLSLTLFDRERAYRILDLTFAHENEKANYLDPFEKFSVLSPDHNTDFNRKGTPLEKLARTLYHHVSFVFKSEVYTNWYNLIHEKCIQASHHFHRAAIFCIILVSFLTLFPVLVLSSLPIFWLWKVLIVGSIVSYKFFEEDIKDPSNLSFFIISFILAIMLPFAVFVNMMYVMYYLTETLIYMFTGLLINYDTTGIGFVAAVAGAGFLMGFVNIYGKYCGLLSAIMGKALELETMDARVRTAEGDSGESQGDVEKRICNQENLITPFKVPFYEGKYVTYIEGKPHIPLEVFETCVENLQPIPNELFKILVFLTSIVLLVYFALEITKSVGDGIHLPSVIGQFLVPVFAIGIIPFLGSITSSAGEQQCKKAAKLQEIVRYLHVYALTGSLDKNGKSFPDNDKHDKESRKAEGPVGADQGERKDKSHNENEYELDTTHINATYYNQLAELNL